MGDPGSKPPQHGVPDLDLDLAPEPQRAKPAPARPKPQPPPAAAPATPLDYFGTGFDEEHFGAGVAASPADTASHAAFGGGIDMDAGDAAAGSALELQSYRPPSAEGAVAPEAPPIPRGTLGPQLPPEPVVHADTAAAALLANYGPAPKSLHLAPFYAYRVLSRQRVLRGEIVRVNREYEQAEAARDEILAELGRSERARLEGDARFEAALTSVRQLEQIAGERGAALSSVNASFDAERSELQRQISGYRAEMERRRAGEQERAALVETAEAQFSRASAKQKRVLIEARSAAQVAQKTAGGPNLPIPGEHAAKIHELEAQAGAMQPEVDARRDELKTAQAELDTIRREIGAYAAHVRRLEDQESALGRRFQGEIAKQSQGVKSAHGEITTALASLGRALVEARESSSLDPAVVEAIRARDAEVTRLAESRELHLRALDVYDKDAVKRGWALVAGSAVAVFLLVVLLVALR